MRNSFVLVLAMAAALPRAHAQGSCAGRLGTEFPAAATLETFRAHAAAYSAAVQDYRGGPRDFPRLHDELLAVRRMLTAPLSAGDRASLCPAVIEVITREHLVDGGAPLVIELTARFCADPRRARRRIAADALAVIDRAGPGPYAKLLRGEPESPDPRARAAREYLSYLLADDAFTGRDWRVTLDARGPLHLIPLLDALSARPDPHRNPATSWLASLYFPETEREIFARELSTLELSVEQIVAWTRVTSPAIWAGWAERLNPVQWLAHRRRSGALDLSDAPEFEARLRAWSRDPARASLGDVRADVRALIEDQGVPTAVVLRMLDALDARWPYVFGARPMIPALSRRASSETILCRMAAWRAR